MSELSHGDEARRALAGAIEHCIWSANMRGKPVATVSATPDMWRIVIAALRADPVRAVKEMEDEQAARRIVSARLAADTDGHGSVDIALKGGRRVLLPLDAPHLPAPEGGSDA